MGKEGGTIIRRATSGELTLTEPSASWLLVSGETLQSDGPIFNARPAIVGETV